MKPSTLLALVALWALTGAIHCKTPTVHTSPSHSHEVNTAETASGGRVEITPLLDEVWIHTTWKDYEGEEIPSNGLIVQRDGSLWLIDSAWGDEETGTLLTLIEAQFGMMPNAVLVTHAHADRASGLELFTTRGIPIWATTHGKTPEARSARENHAPHRSSRRSRSL